MAFVVIPAMMNPASFTSNRSFRCIGHGGGIMIVMVTTRTDVDSSQLLYPSFLLLRLQVPSVDLLVGSAGTCNPGNDVYKPSPLPTKHQDNRKLSMQTEACRSSSSESGHA